MAEHFDEMFIYEKRISLFELKTAFAFNFGLFELKYYKHVIT